MLPRALSGGAAGWSFPRGRGASGEWAALRLGTAGERILPQSGPPSLPRCRRKHGRSGRAGREGEKGMFSYLHSPTPLGRGRAGRGVTVRQAIAASVTTLQQCGLPGSSAQPGGIAVAHGTGGKGLHRAGPAGTGNCCQRQLHRKALQQHQPPSVHFPAPVHGGCTAPSLFLDVVRGFPAMAPSQSLIPAYPPLTSFQASAADSRDFRVLLFKREQTQGTRGSNTSGEKAQRTTRERRSCK